MTKQPPPPPPRMPPRPPVLREVPRPPGPPPPPPLTSNTSDSPAQAAKPAKQRRKRAPREPREPIRPWYQLRLIGRAAHPIQACVATLAVIVVATVDDRGLKGTLIAGAGVLLTQLALGLFNDAYGASADARGGRTNKPIAAGDLPAGNAIFWALVLAMASIPVAMLNGTYAGAALLLTIPVGFIHNRVLYRTPASFLGWMLTFPLIVTYLAYGGWGAGEHGAVPPWQLLTASACLGLVVHFLTALPDLVTDHRAGLAELPLVIARRTGATVLLIVTIVCLIAVAAVTLWCGLHFGIRQR